MSHEIIEHYLNDVLTPQLASLGVPDMFIDRITATVREQILSCVYHWNDVVFRRALLLIGTEEGAFYLPKALRNTRSDILRRFP